jgi:lincosamide nucleotidyltransferase A/C/D/E
MGRSSQMTAAEVVRIVAWLDANSVVYQVNGGWGVDGLVGRQTRPHHDLDVFVDRDHEVAFLAWLTSRGYRVTEDWRPVRVELSSALGRVDVHAMRLDAAGSGVQQGIGGEVYVHAPEHRVIGRIDGRAVVVASAERARQLRSGYPPRAVDLHDLALLDDL